VSNREYKKKVVFLYKFLFLIRIISEPRLQNPYLLYSNTNSHSSPYDYSANEYQQRKVANSFCDIVEAKDELSVHDTCSSCKELSFIKHQFSFNLDGTATRTATIRASPHWLMNNGGNGSRSGSNPSSEFSCLTQNTNILFNNNENPSNNTSHYGFPSISKHHTLINGNSSFDHQQSSSGNSTPNRMKKLFYEVVV
jgi:hypothetical protein